MTRYHCPITAVHTDGTICAHKRASSGGIDPACPGRDGYQATCSCGEELGGYTIRAVLEERREIHLHMHGTLDAHEGDRR